MDTKDRMAIDKLADRAWRKATDDADGEAPRWFVRSFDSAYQRGCNAGAVAGAEAERARAVTRGNPPTDYTGSLVNDQTAEPAMSVNEGAVTIDVPPPEESKEP